VAASPAHPDGQAGADAPAPPTASRPALLAAGYRYAGDAGRMVLTGYTREVQAKGTLDQGESGHCERAATMTEHPGGLDVGWEDCREG
jgi:hypothetical protein